MLEITGEYIPLNTPKPTSTRLQRVRSWFWPVTITAESHGADWIRYLTFENTYKLIRGRFHHRGKRLILSEDLRERNLKDGLDTTDTNGAHA